MAIPNDTIKLIRKYAVKNAIDYGKAKAANVLGKVASGTPKEQLGELRAEIDRTVDEVNSLSKEELLKEYKPYEGEFEEQHERRVESSSKPRMVLDGAVNGSFVTRFPPEPTGYMTIGHAKAAFLVSEFAKIYDGKLLLYFDDSNPEKERQEYVDAFKKDLEWLGIKFGREYYASDSIEKMYDYTRKLIGSGNAYACGCSADEMKLKRFDGAECGHRDAPAKESSEKFEAMLSGKYGEGEMVIRFRGEMGSQNTALRDPTIMRIKKDKHYRQGDKYTTWPTYDLNTPINDSLNGVTDVLRDKNYELRNPLYNMVLDALGLRKPRIHSDARLSIKGQPKQKREVRKLIADHLVEGYDDPRLVTITALRRRGIQPEAIRRFVLSFGMSKMDSVVGMDLLLAENKKIVDPTAKRLYYVPAPVDISIRDFSARKVELKLHPTADLGKREYTVDNRFYISGEDVATLREGDVIKLKELVGIKLEMVDDSWVGEPSDADTAKRFQWVCDGNYLNCSILVPGDPLDENGNFRKDSLRTNNGYIESYAGELKEREIVQLERFGFCILDSKKEMRFIFISK
ncbi:MAG: glutamate--tRNA ligase [Candidatus Micrarchaeaceae archaeon]|jgi:glutamyl-tRNA synthetase|nr:glutamate--tRNA ligase [Candidatus Micrarchaeota archaeon]